MQKNLSSFVRTFIFFTPPGMDSDTFVIAQSKFIPRPGDKIIVRWDECELVLTFDLTTKFQELPVLDEHGVLTYSCRAGKCKVREESNSPAF